MRQLVYNLATVSLPDFCQNVVPLIGPLPDWKVCIAQPKSRLRNFGTKRASRPPDAQIWANVSQTRILAKRECEMLLRNLESAPNAHHSLTKRATGGKERKNTKPMKHDTKNARRMCLRGLDALNLRV